MHRRGLADRSILPVALAFDDDLEGAADAHNEEVGCDSRPEVGQPVRFQEDVVHDDVVPLGGQRRHHAVQPVDQPDAERMDRREAFGCRVTIARR